ncbi:MAG: Bax inhibitor-1/YccA family protein, partial [Firmicutes bacterium]|nr:Bax inhibitor-1/YccA family protein [Bacillota bacterium]
MIVLGCLLGAAPGLLAAITGSSAGTGAVPVVAVVQRQAPALQLTLSQLETRIDPLASFRVAPVNELPALLHQVAAVSGPLQTVVIISQRTPSGVPYVHYVSRVAKPAAVLAIATYEQQAYMRMVLSRIGVTPAVRAMLTATVPLTGKTLTHAANAPVVHMNRFIPIYVLELLLYVWVLLYGNIVAVSVAAEKGSRVQELLITHASPLSLMWGKLTGIALAAFSFLIDFDAADQMVRAGAPE